MTAKETYHLITACSVHVHLSRSDIRRSLAGIYTCRQTHICQ